jgi:hypothetical protein
MSDLAELRRFAVLRGFQSGLWPELATLRDKMDEALADRGVSLAEYLAGADETNLWRWLFEEVPIHEASAEWVQTWNRCATDLCNDLDTQADRIADEVSGL